MLNVLLIDDEYLVLKGVESMLNHQQDFPIHVTSFLDSVHAMEQLFSLQPDVVVLDINMPELNGLSFIEQALSLGFTGSFIIISGYEEVSYLKRAFELHVADYITKPIDKQKLLASLQRLHNARLHMDQTLLMHLHQCLRQVIPVRSASFSRHDWEHLLPQPYLCLISVRRTFSPEQALQIIARMQQYFQVAHFLHFHTADVFLCSLPHALPRRELQAICLACGLTQEDNVGFSRIYRQRDAIGALMEGQECTLLLEASADAILRELRWEDSPSDIPPLPLDVARKLITNADPGEINDLICARLNGAPSPEDAYTACFTEIVAAFLVRHGYQPENGLLAELYRLIRQESADALSLCKSLQTIPHQYLRLMNRFKEASAQYSEKIETAIHYLNSHYADDLSLNDVAEYVGLSASYFSSAFRREVNVSFVKYLKNIRLDKARQLLTSCPHLSVAAVARHVGYQTVGQFYKVFKAELGVSPNSWREQNESVSED